MNRFWKKAGLGSAALALIGVGVGYFTPYGAFAVHGPTVGAGVAAQLACAGVFVSHRKLGEAYLLNAETDKAMDEFKKFVSRIQQYMQKALHEAKVHTSWINPNAEYDDAVTAFVTPCTIGTGISPPARKLASSPL